MTVSGNSGGFFFILCIMILRSVFFIFAIFNRIFQSFQLKVDNSIKSWKKKKNDKKKKSKRILHYFLDKTDISRHFLRCFMKNETEIKVATLTKYKASYVHIQERSLQDKKKKPPIPLPP